MNNLDHLEITFRNEKHSPAVAAHIKNHFIKLKRFFNHIIHCHVTLKIESKIDNKQCLHDAHIIVKIPQSNLVSVNNFSSNLYTAIGLAFEKIQRQLQSKAQHFHAHTSQLKPTQVGVIREVFHDSLFGFIESPQGDYYFNHLHIHKDNFKQLKVGQKVQFTEHDTPQGQQARKIKLCRKQT
jgi:ribosomal subunit interface protein